MVIRNDHAIIQVPSDAVMPPNISSEIVPVVNTAMEKVNLYFPHHLKITLFIQIVVKNSKKIDNIHSIYVNYLKKLSQNSTHKLRYKKDQQMNSIATIHV